MESKGKKSADNLLNSSELWPAEYCQYLIEDYEAEIKRIAYNLHDSVGQNLTIVKLILDRLIDSACSSDYRPQLEAAIQKTQQSIDDLRKISSGIRPKILDEVGLFAALKVMISDYSHANTKLTLNLEIDETRIKSNLKIPIYRISQELVCNIIKHSAATSASLTISEKNSQLNLIVCDNGKGFALENAIKKINSLGLKSIIERIKQSKGEKLVINTSVGCGTETHIAWPI